MNDRYKVASHIAWRRVEDEVVVLDLNTSVYYALNDAGARIWELLSEGKSLDEVVDVLVEEYETDGKTADKDARSFLKDLSREKRLVPA